MVARKRKKKSRMRGSMTHGWGAKKKHRGSGNRGGVGMGGTGKRADSKKPSIWKENYFGKRGFVKKGIKRDIIAINLIDIEQKLNEWVADNKINKEGDKFIIDCSALGYNKLLGKGIVKNKLKIIVESASGKAVEKVTSASGEVLGTEAK